MTSNEPDRPTESVPTPRSIEPAVDHGATEALTAESRDGAGDPTLPIPPAPPLPTAPAAAPVAATPLPRPRTRWAAIVWGLVLAGAAASVLWIITSPARRDGFVDWFATLSVAALVAYALLAVGALLLVAGMVGLIRRLQQRARRSARGDAAIG